MAGWFPKKSAAQNGSSLPIAMNAQYDRLRAAMDHQAKLNAVHRGFLQQQMLGGARSPAPIHKPSAKYPNTLGWRSWVWDLTAKELRSPVQATAWNGPELRCDRWDEADVVRGVAGIHAHLVPDDWHALPIPESPNGGRAYAELHDGQLHACVAVQGIVERFGKFVLGVEGWRAEWVVIRELCAPTEEIGLSLEQSFPDVEIVYGNR